MSGLKHIKYSAWTFKICSYFSYLAQFSLPLLTFLMNHMSQDLKMLCGILFFFFLAPREGPLLLHEPKESMARACQCMHCNLSVVVGCVWSVIGFVKRILEIL